MVRRHKLPYWIEASVPLHRDDIDDLSITSDEAAFLHEFFHNEAPRPDGEGEDDLDLAGWVVVCGNLAVMMSLLYTLAPLPTVYDIYSKKDVGKLPLLPFSIMVVKVREKKKKAKNTTSTRGHFYFILGLLDLNNLLTCSCHLC